MAIVSMTDAVSGQPASSAEYNKLIDNIQDLDGRLTSATNTNNNQATSINTLQTNQGTRGSNGTLYAEVEGLKTTGGALGGRLTALEAKPICVLRKSANQSIPNNADTPLTWQVAEVNVGGMQSGDTIVIPANGTYLIAAQANIQGGGTTAGERVIYVTQGDGHVSSASLATFAMAGNTNTSGVGTGLSTSTIRYLTAGAVIRVKVYQSSGANLAARASEFGGCTFSVKQL